MIIQLNTFIHFHLSFHQNHSLLQLLQFIIFAPFFLLFHFFLKFSKSLKVFAFILRYFCQYLTRFFSGFLQLFLFLKFSSFSVFSKWIIASWFQQNSTSFSSEFLYNYLLFFASLLIIILIVIRILGFLNNFHH